MTGVVLTKLDGSAKGGIVVAIAYELELPVQFIGVGEGSRTCGRSTQTISLARSSPNEARSRRHVLGRELAALFTAGYEGYFVPFRVDAAQLAAMIEAWGHDLDTFARRRGRRRAGRVRAARHSRQPTAGSAASESSGAGAGMGSAVP